MILFLDFDGVLHPFFPTKELTDEENQLFSRTPLLWKILRALPTAKVVISSSWRDSYDFDNMLDFVTHGGGEDAPGVDWPWVEQLFTFYGAWPANLRRTPGAIALPTAAHNFRYEEALASYWKQHGARQHHALEDARSLRHAWKTAVKRGI